MAKNTLTVYGIKNCDTMKKSFNWLANNKVDYVFHDYKKSGIDEKTIRQWLMKHPLSSLINSKGLSYKKLSPSQQEECKNPETAIPLMIQFTSMIKRPLVQTGTKILLGFEPELWEKELL